MLQILALVVVSLSRASNSPCRVDKFRKKSSSTFESLQCSLQVVTIVPGEVLFMKRSSKSTKRPGGTQAQGSPDSAAAAPKWPSYKGKAKLVGTSSSGRVTVYVDPSLGASALQNAQDLLNDADRIVNANDGLFGTTGGPVSAIVFALGGATDGTGGADHMGCDYTTGNAIEVDASYGNPERVSALFEAELSECSMNGNLCGESTGEALSRWCAAVIGNNALSDFATAPQWAQDGMPNWVDQTDNTDQDADSIGCGMAFLSWLLSQGYVLGKIAPAMVALGDAGTLAQLYAQLTGDSAGNAWAKFQSAVQVLPNGAISDDPFAGMPNAAESVRSAESSISSPAPASERITIGLCVPKSKRLLPPVKKMQASKHRQ